MKNRSIQEELNNKEDNDKERNFVRGLE